MMKQIQYPSRGKIVYGYAHVPRKEGPCPALILSHGFTGAAHEASRLFVHFANAACAQGFYVLRIDFLGSGDSDADFAEYTHLNGWVSDLIAGAHFLRSQSEVDPERIGALGISFGAAASLAAGVEACFRAVAGWASVIHPQLTFRSILGEENWDFLAQGGQKISHMYAGARFEVSQQFIKDALAADIPGTVKCYNGKPLLMMQGDRDDVIDPAHAVALAQEVPCEFHLIAGEDHSFSVHREENFRITLDFFSRNLSSIEME